MYVGQLSHLASHARECTFNPENLPDFLKTAVEKDPLQNVHDTSHTGNSTSPLYISARKVPVVYFRIPALKERRVGSRGVHDSQFLNQV